MSPPVARPQLTSEELHQLKWLLGGVLTLVSVATVFYLDVEAWTLLALTVASVTLGLARPAWLARVPRWVHRLAFPFVAAFFSLDLWLSGELLPAIVRLDILLLLYRSFVFRRKREELQLVVLGLFLVVVAGVLSVSLTFAVHILAFAAGALGFLLVITLTEAGGEKTPPLPEGIAPAWTRQLDWRRLLGRVWQVTDWRVVALGGGLFAGLVVLAGLLFLAIPRFQLENGFFLERFMTKQALTGFSDSIRFGDVTEITKDNSVALTVDVSDRSRIPASPYWRMMVLDDYGDGTFRLSKELRAGAFGREMTQMSFSPDSRDAAGSGGAAGFWTFYLESGVSRYLPLLGRFERLQFRERQNYRYSRALRVLALRNDPVSMTAYRVEGMEGSAAVPDATMGRQMRENLAGGIAAMMRRVGLGESDRAVLDRAVDEIQGGQGVGTVEEFARRAESWLAARHVYSLSPRIPEGPGDPLVRWLASNEGGHCELFAGSMVLLARAAGYPARVVTGFRGGSWNGYSNNFTLRNSDAHAWCEVFDVNTDAWVRTDPTPGATAAANGETQGEEGLARRLDRSWTARIDSLRVFWYRRIVNFDQQTQLETLQAVKDATENSGKRLRQALERMGARIKAWWSAPWSGGRATGVVATLIAAAVLIWLLRRLRFTNVDFRWWKKGVRGDAVRTEAGRWLRRMAAYQKFNDESAVVVRELQRLRFGARETWGDAPRVFRNARRAWRGARRRGGRAEAMSDGSR